MIRQKILVAAVAAAMTVAVATPAIATQPDDLPAQGLSVFSRLSPDVIWDWGGVFQNDCVEQAVSAGAHGRFSVRQRPSDGEVTITLQVGNLAAGNYRAIIDGDGGDPGPVSGWELPIVYFTVLPEDDGSAKVEFVAHAESLAPGDYTWGLGVDAINLCLPGNWSVLWTESDLTFTVD